MSTDDFKDKGFATKAVHSGNGIDAETGAIRRPIVLANSFALPYDPSDINWSSSDSALYTRNGGPNQHYLEAKLKALSDCEDAITLASGVAALTSVFFTFLKSGDHAIIANVTYMAVYRQFKELYPEKYNIQVDFVDTTQLENIAAKIRSNTKLIHIETPGNPTLDLADIAAIAALAHEHDILLSVDNTFASPYHQKPANLGADFVIESLTKYINGHGDALGGAVLGKKELLEQIRYQSMVNQGGVISPFNAWLIMRGAVTLNLRMRQHSESALKIATFLEAQPKVRFIRYPGLASFPQHELAKKQMSNGFSGMIAFGLVGSADDHNRFVSALKIITSAVSLGHDESLIVFLGPDDERQYLYSQAFHGGFFRFSVGLEDVEDLIADLDQALKQL